MHPLPFLASALAAAQGIGFGPPRIVRIDDGIFAARAGDFDGDGLIDLAVVNNAKARIELLLRRKPGSFTPEKPDEKNVPADDPLFEKRSLLTEKRVGGFVAADLNGDGKTDLAYYGNPKSLVVAEQGAGGTFERRKEFDIADGSESAGALAAGDVNGDGRVDLVLLAESEIVILLQEKDGLGEPRRISSVLKDVGEVRIADLDGDGRNDLLLVAANDSSPLRMRFQRSDGTLGPEIPFRSTNIRSLAFLGSDYLTVAQASGTLRRWRLRPPEARPLVLASEIALGNLRLFPFGDPKGSRRRSVAVGDIDGDGRADVVATDPAAARVLVYRQNERGELRGPELFPSFRDATGVVVADADGDGRNDVVLFSGDEKAVGIMAWQDGRLAFPRPISVTGTPSALAAADLDRDGKTDLILASKLEKESSLTILWGGADRTEIPLSGGVETSVIRAVDLDRDGNLDLVLGFPFEEMRVLRGRGGRNLEEVPAKTLAKDTSVRGLTPGSTAVGDLDGDGKEELLFSTKNYARALGLAAGGEARILDQLNGPPSADIVSVVSADLDGDGRAEAVLLDKSAKSLLIQKRNAQGVFETVRTFDVGPFEFSALLAQDLTGDGRPDLLVVGLEKMGLIPVGKGDSVPEEISSYEPGERNAYLTSMAVGDLGGPAGNEVAILDPGRSSVEILSPGDKSWTRLLRWKVFETKSYEDRGGRNSEPHGVLIADVIGDAKNDLIVLAHDRVLIYPRE